MATVALAPGSDVSLITEIDFAAIKDATEAGELQIVWGVNATLNGYGSFYSIVSRLFHPELRFERYIGEMIQTNFAIGKDDRDCQQFGTALVTKNDKHGLAGQSPLDFKGIKS